MIKKITAFVVGMLMCTQCAFAYTADDNGYVEISDSLPLESLGYYSETDGRYVVPSTLQHQKITYALLKYGVTLDDIVNGNADLLRSSVTIGQTNVNENGEYTVRVRVKGTTGTYKLVVYNLYAGYVEYDIEYTDYAYKSINEIIENGSISDAQNWIDENLQSIGIDADGYGLLGDADKVAIANMVMGHDKFESNAAVEEFFGAIDICSMIFKSGSFDAADKYIQALYGRNDLFLDKHIVEKYLAMDEASRSSLLELYLNKSFGVSDTDRFYMSVLKNIVDKYKVPEQMSDIIKDRDNIWGFASGDISKLSDSNIPVVYGDMLSYAKTCNTLSDYVAYLPVAIGNNPKTNSGSTGGGSGRTSGGGGNVSIPLPIQNNDTTTGGMVFSDMDGAEWAKAAVEKLAADKIVSGRGNGVFAPNDRVTREEFVKMLMSAMRLTGIDAENKYSDVSDSDWYCAPIAAATRAKIVGGISNKVFGVGRNITREDAAVILKRALDYRNTVLLSESEVVFSDADVISDYAKESVEKLASAGILNGYNDGSFAPMGNITRAEAAKLIYEFMVAIGEYK